jgi:hypothetical protein
MDMVQFRILLFNTIAVSEQNNSNWAQKNAMGEVCTSKAKHQKKSYN